MLLYDVLYESFSERGYSMVEKEERNIPCARDATRYERSREVSPDRDSRTTYPSKKVSRNARRPSVRRIKWKK